MATQEGSFITPLLTTLQYTPLEERGSDACESDVELLITMMNNHLKYNNYSIVQLLLTQLNIVQANPYNFKANMIIDNICPVIFDPAVLKIIRDYDASQKDETKRIMRRYIYLCCLWQLTTGFTDKIVYLLQDIEGLKVYNNQFVVIAAWIRLKVSMYFSLVKMPPAEAFVAVYTSKMPRDFKIQNRWVDSIAEMWELSDKSWMIALIMVYVKGHSHPNKEERYRFDTEQLLLDSKYIIHCFCVHMLQTIKDIRPEVNLILYGMQCIAMDRDPGNTVSQQKYLKHTTSHIYDLDVAPQQGPYIGPNGRFILFRENYIGMMTNSRLVDKCVTNIPYGIELSTDMEIREVANKIAGERKVTWWSALVRRKLYL